MVKVEATPDMEAELASGEHRGEFTRRFRAASRG
jgi:hypothetical protein